MENPIQSTFADGTATVALLGEIDFSNADEVADGIREAVAEWRPLVLRVDLKAAAFIDSTGLGALIEGYQAATEAQTTFMVANPTPNFRRVLAVTGLTELFGLSAVDASEEPAIDFETSEATGA
ncbi:STAS domain-containing protein [Actinoplanes sp. NPDC051633]|jgi:anti-sigma B factor antagonist|uniref:STAS domain-containing protein n=1 Tax=Actinoplanes sp. NPDC051633 TaxID=3155670 RepID=UPI00343C66F2